MVFAREYQKYDTMLQEEMDAAMDDPPEEGEEVYEAYEGRLIDDTKAADQKPEDGKSPEQIQEESKGVVHRGIQGVQDIVDSAG